MPIRLENHIRIFHEGCGGIIIGDITTPYASLRCAECQRPADSVNCRETVCLRIVGVDIQPDELELTRQSIQQYYEAKKNS